MDRKDFLKLAPGAALALMINGFPIRTLAGNSLLSLLGHQTQNNGRVLVLIQLAGGNDGLNTIIPIDRYSELSVARSNILIPENRVLKLNDTSNTGMHPSMSGIQDLYNNGLLNITQGVSYPNPNYSHFRATDIWLTGSDATQYLNDGWLGRYLAQKYPDYPKAYPNDAMSDPLAIEIGSSISSALIGPEVEMGMALTSVDSFYNIVNNTVSPAPATPAGHELTFLRFIAQQTQQYTAVLQKAAAKAKNLSAKYPSPNTLADQLKIVARLIAGGLHTPIYVVSMGGFDSHVNQVSTSDTTTGNHAGLLSRLSEAITAFFDDCKLLGIDDRITAMTFSEFGRRIISNGGLGTDHGAAQPIMVFGNQVNSGFIGHSPRIPANATVQDNLEMQYDYRSVYASLLSDWFELDHLVLDNVLMNNYPILPIFKKKTVSVTTGNNDIISQNYPNPFVTATTINFISRGGDVAILLLDGNGRVIKSLVKGNYNDGSYQISIAREDLPAGTYFYRYIHAGYSITKKMLIIDAR